jgi:2-keto-3-deoxy-6-phosphogluconate aldolase
MTGMLRDCLQRLPLIAILRGMKPEEAAWVLEALAGFSILESAAELAAPAGEHRLSRPPTRHPAS